MSTTPAAIAAHSSGNNNGGASHGAKRIRTERSGWRNIGTGDIHPLRKYTPQPTPGTARLHSTQDYGFTDFYPAKAGQSETQLTERTIRYGFVDTPVVENEYQTGHDIVNERLQDTRVFHELQQFAAGVAQRQGARGGVASNALPRLPNRSVRTDEQRDEWLRALANPRVPLSVLVGHTPFGLRGDRLLDALSQHCVPLQRAVWAIRLIGVFEMLGMQTRAPDHASLRALEAQFTVQWSKQFMQFVERTLAAAPTNADTAGASSPPASESGAWARSWSFCLALFHAQYNHGLLDQRHMVSWLVGLLRQLPVDKCMVALRLLADYTGEIGKSRNPLRKLIGAVVFRIEHAARYPALRVFQVQLSRFLVSLFTAYPDAFVEPTTWPAYSAALQNAGAMCDDAVRSALPRVLAQVTARNRNFSSLLDSANALKATVAATVSPGKEAESLAVLASLSPDSDIALAFRALFRPGGSSAAHTVRLVCYWAVEDQIAPFASQFRALAAARLCRLLLDSPETQASEVHRAVVGFLDIFHLPNASSDTSSSRRSAVRRICLLLERLFDVGCFSISRYLQLLTARGDFFGANAKSQRSQRHLEYVTSVPCRSAEDRDQRQMLLYDCAAGQVSPGSYQPLEVSDICSQLKREISALLPFLLAYSCAAPLRALDNDRKPTVGLDTVRWWMPKPTGEVDLSNPRMLPTASSFSVVPLSSSLANSVCTKDWISPLVDHIDDLSVLNRGFTSDIPRLLATAPRSVVDQVVNQRLMPVVFDYVVKEVKVGVDNWRVITRPGTSLLNRRQAAAIIHLLAEAEHFGQLLDFLLWTIGHTSAGQVLPLVHCTLRQFAHAWKLLGRLPTAVTELTKAYESMGGQGGSADIFDFELLRTAMYWAEIDMEAAGALSERLSQDYQQYVTAQTHLLLLQNSQAPGQPATASKDLLQLAQQLVRDCQHKEALSDQTDWAILPCFQKLIRWAQSTVQRSEFATTPAPMQYDLPSSSPAGVSTMSRQQPRLRSIVAHIVADSTQAALLTSMSLPLAPQASSERPRDEAVLRCFVELCAQYVQWVAVSSGLVLSPECVGSVLLNAISSTVDAWSLSNHNSSSSSSLTAHGHSVSGASSSEIEVAIHVSQMWVTCLVNNGCLRIVDLIPWAIEQCRQEALPQNTARFACIAGVIRALAMPLSSYSSTEQQNKQHKELQPRDNAGREIPDMRQMHQLLEMGASWKTTLVGNRVSRIQSIELVFTGASASGRLRATGASQLATVLMRSTAELAQSAWIQQIVDYIPAHEEPVSASTSGEAGSTNRQKYYSLLEIYRANIEKQINDPSMVLPIKRAILRALMTLCEGIDPETEGFSAMTTAEVAHRIHETIRRFWYGPAIKGNAGTAVSKLATILNSLLLFASTALQESEATTDAFAIAAGASAIPGGISDPAASMDPTGGVHQDADHISQGLSRESEQVQFVTNTTAYLSSCVQDAVLQWDAESTEILSLLPRKCASLSHALATLNPEILLKLAETCSVALLLLNLAHLRVAVGCAEKVGGENPSNSAQDALSVLDRRVAAIIDACRIDVPTMLEPLFTLNSDQDPSVDSVGCADGNCAPGDSKSFTAETAARGSALARLVRQLVMQLAQGFQEDDEPGVFDAGGLLASTRDFATGVLAQLQTIAVYINPAVARLLSLRVTLHPPSQNNSPKANQSGSPDQNLQPSDECLRMAVLWRLQAVQPLCGLMRRFPDQFGAGEWLMTLVTLCLSPVCQDTPDASGHCSGLYQFLLDFAAVTNESITATMRKHTLGLLKSVTPLLRSMKQSQQYAGALGRLFPFDINNTLTCDIIQPGSIAQNISGLDNPWLWIDSLEFVPLESLKTTAISAGGLEGMTPFTLRGMVEQENMARSEKSLMTGAPSAANTGYLANVQRNNSGAKPEVGIVRNLQYLENPYFPMQPAFLFPLAETPISWQAFAAKRKRMDSETRLVWRYQCYAAFGS
ncbi:hypothetical protein FB639_000675 [Coemansia asiatica]|nr:hypothetical protein FB639_000675 [Coemansia asiatica]